MIKVDITAHIPSLNNANLFHQKIQAAIQIIAIKLTNKIKTDKLSGQVLKVKTGRLRNSIHSKVSSSSNLINAEVGTNVKYARVHEYGFNGNVSVKSHLRQIKQVFGKTIAPRTIQIGSHTRKAVFPQRSFLRTSLNEMRADIVNQIRQSIRN